MIPHRSLLFVPTLNARAVEKAKTLPCDGLILDLEDSILSNRKDEARKTAKETIEKGGFEAPLIMVRVNAADTDFFQDDLEALSHLELDAVLIPKVETAEDIHHAEAALGKNKNTKIWFMIESALGVLNMRQICEASDRLGGFMIGPNDLLKDLHAPDTAGQEALMGAHGMCLLAARAFGLICIDGVYKSFQNSDGYEHNCKLGKTLGYDGKSLIHPNQIGAANRIFGPSDDEIDLAKRQVAAFDEAAELGKGIAVVEGALVEHLHADTARKLLKMAEQISEREGL